MIKNEEFLTDVEELLELDPKTLTGKEPLTDLNWDSMSVVSFIAMADSKYNVSVAVAELKNCQTVDDLFSLIQS